jgi:hypothetical protein
MKESSALRKFLTRLFNAVALVCDKVVGAGGTSAFAPASEVRITNEKHSHTIRQQKRRGGSTDPAL